MSTGYATAPGSSANLGPGFDCVGLAVELRCRVSARPADRWTVTELGRTFEPAQTDLVRLVADKAVGRPLHLEIDNDVPRSRGLGSSAAVMVATAAAAMRAAGEEPESVGLYELVTDIEGHGDNAGAAVFGGLVAVAGGELRHLELSPELHFVFGVPDDRLRTSHARSALPDQVPRAAAVRNAARLAFLVEGLRTGDPGALAQAGGDELHEVYRSPLSPVTGELMAAAGQAGALHTSWSGAGPTALAIAFDPAPVAAAMEEVLERRGSVMVLDVARTGWT